MPIASATEREIQFFPTGTAWEDGPDGVRLLAAECARCGQLSFPPTGDCWRCGSAGTPGALPLSRTGTLHTFSVVHVAPAGFRPPYAVGQVDLPEGLRVLARLEVADPVLDEPLEVALGVIRTDPETVSYVFRRPA